MNFYQALIEAYNNDPCRVLSIPLWKTLLTLDECEQELWLGPGQCVDHLEAWTEKRMEVYWDRQGAWRPSAPASVLDNLELTVVHSKYASNLNLTSNQTVQRFFRLKYVSSETPFDLPAGFKFAPVRLPDEVGLVSQVIGRCYAHMRPGVDEVVRWSRQPVFDAGLWIWMIDTRVNQPAGLGIAEIDHQNQEASLEWIQVIPEYRGQGLAKALVDELLWRLRDKVILITVSGEADNPTDAEHVYRRCGFAGSDVWWVVRQLGL